MINLKVIENEIVPVYETEKGIKVVNGRELHAVLESKQDFSTWVKRRLAECDAEENEDFDTAPQIYGTANGGHSTRNEYLIKLDTAKEMAMLERNEKGKQVRKYFIAVEKKYKKTYIPMTIPEQIQLLAQGTVELNQRVDTLDKKLERLEYDLPVLPVEADRITEAVKKKGTAVLGGKLSNAYKSRSIRQKVYSNIHSNLRYQFQVKSYKSIKRNQVDKAVDIIGRYEPPVFLQNEIDAENAQETMF